MNDTICRQAAIRLITGYNGVVDKSVARRLLIQMPSAQPEWIPCSERLPKKPNVYMVTDHNGDVVRFGFYGTESSREYWLRCAKAWMPLPEPYKGDQDGQEPDNEL